METHHNTNEVVPVSFRLTVEEHETLKRIAAREHRSMSGQVRAWIAAAAEPEKAAA